jgi:hypothetical protein
MGSVPKDGDENYSDEEAARRRDEVIRRMANTPPQPKRKKTGEASPAKKPKAPPKA